MDTELIKLEAEEAMEKALTYMNHEFSIIRTGKANPAIVENLDIKVQIYGSSMKLKQLAMISTPEPRLILIQAYDASTTKDIEKGIIDSKLDLNPQLEGKNIRIPIPELTEERRIGLVKMLKQIAEETRVRMRQARRDAIDNLKKAQKNSEITEDSLHNEEDNIQKLTDKYIENIAENLNHKEKEIMTV